MNGRGRKNVLLLISLLLCLLSFGRSLMLVMLCSFVFNISWNLFSCSLAVSADVHLSMILRFGSRCVLLLQVEPFYHTHTRIINAAL